jgi:single-strand DNA-binding protein
MFGKRAEVINKYCKRGNPLFVEGRLTFDSWEAQDGTKRSKLRVTVENFEFISGGGGGGGGGAGGGGQTRQSMGGMDSQVPQQAGEDDIPF